MTLNVDHRLSPHVGRRGSMICSGVAIFILASGRPSDFGQQPPLVSDTGFLHRLAGIDQPGDPPHRVNAFDDVVLDIVFMGHAFSNRSPAIMLLVHTKRSIPAKSWKADAIMVADVMTSAARACRSRHPAQAQQCCVAVAASVTRHRLHGEERKPSFPAQPLHDVDGRDIDIALGTAVMRLAGKDGRDVAIERLIVERIAPTDLVGVAAEPGGKAVMGHGAVLPWVWVSRSEAPR
jgi:hypothetical protein